MNLSKKHGLLLVSCIVLLCCNLYFSSVKTDIHIWKSRDNESTKYYSKKLHQVQEEAEPPNNTTKYILFWTTEGARKNFHFNANGSELFSKCEVSDCYATYNASLMAHENFDAIFFFVPTSTEHPKEVVPFRRKPKQRYVFVFPETPVRFGRPQSQYLFDSFYNWTMTYRSDSDIPRKHGQVEKQKTEYEIPSTAFVRNKTRSVAWMVSNCKTPGKREKLVSELSKHIDVDIYGDCGTLRCPKHFNCHEMIEKKYRFYLSFENSYCRDYVTEKLYGVLQRNIVPIVYGSANYTLDAPPNSVINVEDFESAEMLAKYLKSLEGNVDKYLEYFLWKKDYRIITNSQISACKLCKMLHDKTEPQKVYDNIYKWWYSKEYSGCRTESDLPSIIPND